MPPAHYTKRPVTIEAEQLAEDGSNADALVAWIGRGDATIRRALARPTDPKSLRVYIDIRTLEGTMTADPGDWIIRGVQGEFYPAKPAIFAETYEAVE